MAERLTVGALAAAAALVIGCDCDRAKERMEVTAEQGFAQAWACCQEIRTIDPPAAMACFDDLRQWRQELTTLIVQWYQACLEGNASLADSILRTMRQLFVDKVDGPCGNVVVDGRGQRRTIGIAFAPGDSVIMKGDLRPVPGNFGGPPDDRGGGGRGDGGEGGEGDAPSGSFEVSGVASLTIGSTSIDVPLAGSLALRAPLRGAGGGGGDPGQPITHELARFDLTCELSSHPGDGASIRLVRSGPDGISHLSLEGSHAHVRVACDVEPLGRLPFLLPAKVWLELPLIAATDEAGGFLFADGAHALRSVLPPALGFADFNGDGSVDDADIVAYRAAALKERDLDLDGDVDADDARLFMKAWQFAQPSSESPARP